MSTISRQMAIEALNCSEIPNNSDTISRQAAIRWIKAECNPYGKPTLDYETSCRIMEHLDRMPSAEPDVAEKLHRFKCCITDKKGFQHEVIYIDDIKRVTGWVLVFGKMVTGQ